MNDQKPPPPPPQPPPHNENSRNGLPPGNYDIFIIPPHSSGGGFLYLPSLQPHRNSFLAGVGSTVLVILIWISVVPILKQWLAHVVASGSVGIAFLLCSVGLLGWLWGQWQMQQRSASGSYQSNAWNTGPQPPPQNDQNNGYANSQYSGAQSQWGGDPPPNMNNQGQGQSQNQYQRTSPSGAGQESSAKSGWEKAREETRRREEERKRMDELRKKAEELKKKRAEDEKAKLAQREKETREREARERREKLMKEREQRKEQEANEAKNSTKQPTARDEADEEQYSYRPYDKPKPAPPSHSPKAQSTPAATAAQRAAGHNYNGSAGSSKAHSTYSFAQTHSTSKTTPPQSTTGGPYQTKDPDKIVLKAVYSFNDTHVKIPIAQLVSGVGNVTDGLILRITSEGLFIDDDVRAVPQREWDVKAWTMKGVETGSHSSTHIIRASIRDTEGKRYVFILRDDQGWKLPGGITRLKKGSTVRQLAVGALGEGEVRTFLESRGWA